MTLDSTEQVKAAIAEKQERERQAELKAMDAERRRYVTLLSRSDAPEDGDGDELLTLIDKLGITAEAMVEDRQAIAEYRRELDYHRRLDEYAEAYTAAHRKWTDAHEAEVAARTEAQRADFARGKAKLARGRLATIKRRRAFLFEDQTEDDVPVLRTEVKAKGKAKAKAKG